MRNATFGHTLWSRIGAGPLNGRRESGRVPLLPISRTEMSGQYGSRGHRESGFYYGVEMTFIDRIWPGLKRDLILNRVVASPLFPKPMRWRALKLYGMAVESSNISPDVWFGSERISIGLRTTINYGCMFNTSSPITIGAGCDIAMQVLFATSSHEIGPGSRRAGRAISSPITVGDGVWIGARSVVLPGVHIGAGSIIAAGSVVTEDCDANSLYAGVPARKIRSLS